MNQIKKILGLAVACAVMVFAVPAFCEGAPQSLGITNYLISGVSFSSYPTNATGTATGKGVPVYNQRSVGLNFQGSLVSTGAVTVGIALRTSMAGNAPGSSNDYDVGGSGAPTWVTFAFAAGTNWINGQSQLASTTVFSEANYVGISQITNNLGTGQYITNTAAYINKKTIPATLVGR